MGYQLSCTMFCACGGGQDCSNPFNTRQHESNGIDDVDNHDYNCGKEENRDVNFIIFFLAI